MDQTKMPLGRGSTHAIARRGRAAAVAISAAAAVGMMIKYQADAIRNNELAQKTSRYVSVERSGGGI
ncbi:hypothetical protein RB595_001673 [Gaeumannomyces hyphopodioides]